MYNLIELKYLKICWLVSPLEYFPPDSNLGTLLWWLSSLRMAKNIWTFFFETDLIMARQGSALIFCGIWLIFDRLFDWFLCDYVFLSSIWQYNRYLGTKTYVFPLSSSQTTQHLNSSCDLVTKTYLKSVFFPILENFRINKGLYSYYMVLFNKLLLASVLKTSWFN